MNLKYANIFFTTINLISSVFYWVVAAKIHGGLIPGNKLFWQKLARSFFIAQEILIAIVWVFSVIQL